MEGVTIFHQTSTDIESMFLWVYDTKTELQAVLHTEVIHKGNIALDRT